jgi:hypothetical protein
MKLWKSNRLDQEWEMTNEEIAQKFMESGYAKTCWEFGGLRMALVSFIASKDGLNSTWEWNEKRGSIEGSPDFLDILDRIAFFKAQWAWEHYEGLPICVDCVNMAACSFSPSNSCSFYKEPDKE